MDKTVNISVERKQTLLCEPHLMAFSHILEHLPADESMEKRGVIACTDGMRVWYGTQYLALPTAERAYIHVHELSHAIFMHADRAQLLRLLKGTLNPALFNYAGDAIINEGIEANPAMPSGMFTPPVAFPPVKMDFIHKAMAEAIKFTGEKPPVNYDPKAIGGMQVEVIYDWLMWALDATLRKRDQMEKDCPRAQQKKQERKDGKSKSKPADDEGGKDKGDQDDQPKGDDGDEQQPGDDGQGDEQGGGEQPGPDGDKCDPKGSPSKKPCTCGRCDQDGKGQGQAGEGEGGQGNAALGGGNQGLTQIERMADDEAWDLEEQLGRLKKLLDEGRTTTELIDEINGRIIDARERIEQVVQGLKMQGSGQGSILLELHADLPLAVVPWNVYLRRLTNRGLGTKLNDSYVRKGVPTMTALARGARCIPFSPGTTIFTEKPRVLVVLDVSGSHIGLLPICFSEIWSIAQKKGAVVEVLTFDDGVQQILEIKTKRDLMQIMRKGLRGGGGTSLQGVWDRIAKMRDPYRMCVVMTDGYLAAGKKPKIPVVWMVTPGGRGDFGYGEEIFLPQIVQPVRKAA